MLRFRGINDGVALWHISMTAWLIEKFGSPLPPPIPKPTNYQTPLHLRCWNNSETRMPLEWAQDEFKLICKHMHMDKMNISLVPEKTPECLKEAYTQNRTFSGGWQTQNRTRVKLNVSGKPVVTYNPKHCHIPGYLSATTIIDLAKIFVGSHVPPEDFDYFFEVPLTLLGAAHLGQGFTLAAMSPELIQTVLVGKKMSKKEIEEFFDVVTFISVLTMSCRRLSPEQTISSFGKIMAPNVRKRIWPMYKNLERFEDEIEHLRSQCGSVLGTSVSMKKTFVSQPLSRIQHA